MKAVGLLVHRRIVVAVLGRGRSCRPVVLAIGRIVNDVLVVYGASRRSGPTPDRPRPLGSLGRHALCARSSSGGGRVQSRSAFPTLCRRGARFGGSGVGAGFGAGFGAGRAPGRAPLCRRAQGPLRLRLGVCFCLGGKAQESHRERARVVDELVHHLERPLGERRVARLDERRAVVPEAKDPRQRRM